MQQQSLSNCEIRERLEFPDEQLIRECELQPYQASGPGGQKRNRTYSAVRLVHRPTGISVTASESRSQLENRRRALKRLRETIAVQVRLPVPESPQLPHGVQITHDRLQVNPGNPHAVAVVALLLDAFEVHRGQLGDVAAYFQVTSSSLVRLLAEHPRAWVELNRIRHNNSLAALHT